MFVGVSAKPDNRIDGQCRKIGMCLLGSAAVLLLREDQVGFDSSIFNGRPSAASPRNVFDKIAVFPEFVHELPIVRYSIVF